MSRAAQEMQRAADEMMRRQKRSQKKERRMADGDVPDDAVEIDAESPSETIEMVETTTGFVAPLDSPAAETTATAEGETTMAKKTTRAKKATAKRKSARRPKAVTVGTAPARKRGPRVPLAGKETLELVRHALKAYRSEMSDAEQALADKLLARIAERIG